MMTFVKGLIKDLYLFLVYITHSHLTTSSLSLLFFPFLFRYYQHGEGMKTVNSGNSLQPFPLNNPPVFSQIALTGTNACKGTFASEFGGVAISSFESLSPTLDPSHWALHANPMSERNYAVDNFVTAIANLTWPDAFNTTGELNFKGMLYFAMLSQALWVKSDIESRRTQNNFGIITWQFNEIWPTG